MHPLTFFLFAAVLPTVWLMQRKALDDFVKLRDCHYKYTLLEKTSLFEPPGMDLITINMTSQKWLDESEVDNPVWSHEILMIVPPVLNPVNSCLLIITPGEDDDSSLVDYIDLQRPAEFLKTPVAVLKPLPVQPLTFYNHPLGHKNITGLDIFAYSWWRFLNDPVAPPYWLVQFPMVKATVRAMDTIRDYVKKNYHADITGFTLAGISMGGWIAWLTAAVDQRVNATVHVAMDFLNFTESFYHQYRAYCGWSYMLRPFYEMNITRELNNPRFSDLASHVDPLAYNERYTNVTKLIIVLSGDELFQPDNTRNYFSQLEGTKYLRVIPNHDYGIYNGFEVVDGIFYFYTYMANNSGLFPTISWEIIMV